MRFWALLLVTALACSCRVTTPAAASTRTQYVVLSFDDLAPAISAWDNTLEFGLNHHVKYTFFIPATTYLTKSNLARYRYVVPGHPVNATEVWLPWSQGTARMQADLTDLALRQGHEIAYHSVGHLYGADWDELQWDHDFETGRRMFREAFIYLDTQWRPDNTMTGFRAPGLQVNDAMFRSLARHRFHYDASLVSDGSWWVRTNAGVLCFPLYGNLLAGTKQNVICMDYSIFQAQTGARTVDDAVVLAQLKDQVVNTYANLYLRCRDRDQPVFIGHHMNSNWNHGIYWKAMKEWVWWVQDQYPDTRFITYQDLIRIKKL